MKLVKLLVMTVVSALADFGLAGLMMVWLDIANHFDERVPAFGYWTCFFLLWTLTTPVSSVLLARDIREELDL